MRPAVGGSRPNYHIGLGIIATSLMGCNLDLEIIKSSECAAKLNSNPLKNLSHDRRLTIMNTLHAVRGERRGLRIAQSKAVMPMIGPLLDAWEQLPNDDRAYLIAHAPSLCRQLDLIDNAMENSLSAQMADEI